MRLVVASLILFVAVVAVFWPALNNSYVNYDDPEYLIANLQVQGGLNWANVKWAFVTTATSNWHPLTWLSHMLDCQIFGPKLWGHHLTSVVLHSLNAVLVFLLLHNSTSALWRSLIVAACFGVHPLRVESVAWLSERKDVLSGFFGLAALLAYISYCRSAAVPKEISPRPLPSILSSPGARYLLTFLLFALSLLSKPMMVTLPFVMLLLDLWPLQRDHRLGWWRLALEKGPFLLLSVAASVATVVVQRSGGAMEEMAHYSMFHHAQNALVSYARYLGKFFWPTNLSPIYPVVEHWPIWTVAGAAVLIFGAALLLLLFRKRAPYGLVGWLWFLGTLIPVIGLVAVGEQAMADRYTYFSLIGISMVLVWGIEDLTKRWCRRLLWACVISIGLLLVCAAATWQQVKVWANSETLFRHALASTSNNYSAHANLSTALQEQGRLEEALFHAREAARLRPDSPETLNNLGASLGRMGRVDEAISVFQQALRVRPAYAEGHRNLAIALVQSGRLPEAIEHYVEAVRILSGQAAWHDEFGVALAKAGRLDEAITQFQHAVQIEPRYAIAHNHLGNALSQQGRFGEAALHLQEAARLSSGNDQRR